MNVYKDNLQYLEKIDSFIDIDSMHLTKSYKLRLTYRKPRKRLWDKQWSIILTYTSDQISMLEEDLKYFRNILKQ